MYVLRGGNDMLLMEGLNAIGKLLITSYGHPI